MSNTRTKSMMTTHAKRRAGEQQGCKRCIKFATPRKTNRVAKANPPTLSKGIATAAACPRGADTPSRPHSPLASFRCFPVTFQCAVNDPRLWPLVDVMYSDRGKGPRPSAAQQGYGRGMGDPNWGYGYGNQGRGGKGMYPPMGMPGPPSYPPPDLRGPPPGPPRRSGGGGGRGNPRPNGPALPPAHLPPAPGPMAFSPDHFLRPRHDFLPRGGGPAGPPPPRRPPAPKTAGSRLPDIDYAQIGESVADWHQEQAQRCREAWPAWQEVYSTLRKLLQTRFGSHLELHVFGSFIQVPAPPLHKPIARDAPSFVGKIFSVKKHRG